jgi:DNA-binding cell septation regulator SpoVG
MNLLSNIRIKLVKKIGNLIGFASFNFKGDFLCSGVAIHQSYGGEYFLKYPAKRINDDLVYYFRPLNRQLAEQIQEEIITEFLKVQGRATWVTQQTKETPRFEDEFSLQTNF